jgi:hypothetical protein
MQQQLYFHLHLTGENMSVSLINTEVKPFKATAFTMANSSMSPMPT